MKILLIIFIGYLVFFSTMSCASMQVLQEVIYQIKVVLTNQLAKKNIEEVINKAVT